MKKVLFCLTRFLIQRIFIVDNYYLWENECQALNNKPKFKVRVTEINPFNVKFRRKLIYMQAIKGNIIFSQQLKVIRFNYYD